MTSTSAPPALGSFRIQKPQFRLSAMQGVIDRRILVNVRCHPGVLRRILPAPFRPKLVQGWGMAGICLIRLVKIRPRWFPLALGATSENAAHRIAVEWDEGGKRCEGVFIQRRDTDSQLNVLAGRHLFPSLHHLARIEVWESPCRFKIGIQSLDGLVRVRVAARVADDWPGGSVFASLDHASSFFAAGSLGWSIGSHADALDGVELQSSNWRMEALAAERVESSFFENRGVFPPGSVEFDSALLMRGVEHEWHGRGRMCCAGGPAASPPALAAPHESPTGIL